MNVLAVTATAPGLPSLASSEELARIGDVPGISLRTLTDATAERVAHRLSQEKFDLLLWIGHGTAGELLTQDGAIDPQWLAAQLSSRNVQRAVIATCWSGDRPEGGQQAAQSFADALPAAGIDTITMATEISDRAAIEYDVELLRQLASGATLRTAHQVALNRAQQWGGVKAPQLTPRDGGAHERIPVAVPVMPGAHSTLHIEQRMTVLERDIKRLWEFIRPGPRQTVARVVFYGLLICVWSLWMIKESRDWLVMHPAQAIVISLALVLAALIIRWLPEDDHDQR